MCSEKNAVEYSKRVNNCTYWISHILPRCGDDGEGKEKGGGGGVVETEDTGVDGDAVWLDKALEPTEDIQHNAWIWPIEQNLS